MILHSLRCPTALILISTATYQEVTAGPIEPPLLLICLILRDAVKAMRYLAIDHNAVLKWKTDHWPPSRIQLVLCDGKVVKVVSGYGLHMITLKMETRFSVWPCINHRRNIGAMEDGIVVADICYKANLTHFA